MANQHERSKILVKTFVFLDLEATGLFPDEPLNPLNSPHTPSDTPRDSFYLLKNYIQTTNPRNAPHITEISLVAVSRKQVETVIKRTSLLCDDAFSKSQPVHHISRLPCNVHTRQINPQLDKAAWISYESRRAKSNALCYSQFELEDKNDFTTEWQGIKLFLEQLPKPLCILAHNGVKFDFRVLYAEIVRANLQQTNVFPADIYFIDSYTMFMDIEKKLHNELRGLTQMVDWRMIGNQRKLEVCSYFSPEACATCDGASKSTEDQNPQSLKRNTEEQIGVQEVMRLKQYETPTKRPLEQESFSEPVRNPKRVLRFDINDDHPLHFVRTSSWSPAKRIRIRPNFFRRTIDGDWQFDNHLALQYFTEKGAFRLEDMYRQLTQRDFDPHYAQNDCEALLQICLAYGQDFLDYVDTYAAKFPF